jgi:hypothetical protein
LVPKKAHNKKFVGAAFGMMNEWTPAPPPPKRACLSFQPAK